MAAITRDLAGNVIEKPFTWSWTSLSNYETCPKKYFHASIQKDFPDEAGPDGNWGLRVHKALADRIDRARPLPPDMPYEKHVEDVLRVADRTEITTSTEKRLAVTAQLKPCDYFAKDVWFRCIADVFKIRPADRLARVIDWKTGKFKEGSDQLLLTAACVMAHYPMIDKVLCQYYWLQSDLITEEEFTRSGLAQLWSRILPRVDKIQTSHRTGEWMPKPSGLCVKWCPVTSCQYHGVGNR